MWVYGLDRAGPGQRQVADDCECGNEPCGSVKCGEFLDQLQTSQLLKKDSAPWSKQVCSKPARIRSTSSPAVHGRPLDFCLHRHPVSVYCLQHTRIFLSVGGSFVYFARNTRCTVTTDLLCDIPTHRTTSPPERPFSHYIHSHRLAVEM